MALTPDQQAFELITRAKRVLLVTREQAPVDALASVAALRAYLLKLGKNVDTFVPGLNASRVPKFLPGADKLSATLGAIRAFELSLNVTDTKLENISYDVRDNKLVVSVVPQSGEWAASDVSFKAGADRYDLIIACDAADMGSLGALFHEHADFIYRTPVINIDRDPTNEHWGQVNLVDLTAVSTTEMLYGLMQTWDRSHIDADIATSILAGMIAKTNSFRAMNVTPRTLQRASELTSIGARREEIVHGLWRTKDVATLRLWGRALSRLDTDRDHGIVWTTLTHGDFIEAGAGPEALAELVPDLVAYAPEAKIVVIANESQDATHGIQITLHAAPPFSAHELGRAFNATGTRDRVSFRLVDTTLAQAVTDVTTRLKQIVDAIHR